MILSYEAIGFCIFIITGSKIWKLFAQMYDVLMCFIAIRKYSSSLFAVIHTFMAIFCSQGYVLSHFKVCISHIKTSIFERMKVLREYYYFTMYYYSRTIFTHNICKYIQIINFYIHKKFLHLRKENFLHPFLVNANVLS